jgi:hypothetical protein
VEHGQPNLLSQLNEWLASELKDRQYKIDHPMIVEEFEPRDGGQFARYCQFAARRHSINKD